MVSVDARFVDITIVSVPSPASMLSFPPPAVIVSLPAPPRSTSLPPPPVIASAPAPPDSVCVFPASVVPDATSVSSELLPVSVTLSVDVVVTSSAPAVEEMFVSPSASEVVIVIVPELLLTTVRVVVASIASIKVAPLPSRVTDTEAAVIVPEPSENSTA